jgi:hypothetical protein
LQPKSSEALLFYHLSRACLALDSVLEKPSLEGIQAMLVMAHFMFLADIDEPRWMIMGLVIKMAESVSSPDDFNTRRINRDLDGTPYVSIHS